MLGFGGVARCALPLLLRHLDLPYNNLMILDFEDKREELLPYLQKGAQFIHQRIDKENIQEVLEKYLSAGDIIIDLSTYIGCMDILNWCHNHNVLYVNTSIEVWDLEELKGQHFTGLTLYARHMNLRKMPDLNSKNGPTAVLDHGANPGLVSHFARLGLKDIAQKILQEKPQDPRRADLEKALSDENFARLGELTGTKVIHISERDTQIISDPKKTNEFVNTWSLDGLAEEAIAPAELGWGTHEKNIPPGSGIHNDGPQNQICLPQMGLDTWVRSWVPSGEIVGMVIRHGEAFTLSDYLTVWEDNKARYRPSVYYAYCPADYAINSVHEYKMRRFDLQPQKRIARDEIISGHDELGTLLMGHDYKSWWVGSILTIEEARKLLPGENATLVQVAISVVGAALWVINNPNRGLNVPEELPYDEILKIAKPYLGEFISAPVDWDPLKYQFPSYTKFAETPRDKSDVWQFQNFLD